MAEIEDELKAQNWLSIFTFDAYKLIGAGGNLVVSQDGNDLVFRLLNANPNTPGVNRKLGRLVTEAAELVVIGEKEVRG